MASSPVETIVEQVKALSTDDQIKVAEAIDQLTWAQRWRRICQHIQDRRQQMPEISDDQIAEVVRRTRQETPLSARSSTHPS